MIWCEILGDERAMLAMFQQINMTNLTMAAAAGTLTLKMQVGDSVSGKMISWDHISITTKRDTKGTTWHAAVLSKPSVADISRPLPTPSLSPWEQKTPQVCRCDMSGPNMWVGCTCGAAKAEQRRKCKECGR